MGIRILLADDHQIMLQGLRALLEGEPDIEVVGEARDGRTALGLVGDRLPDVVIMDIEMPELNGIEAARMIVAESPGVKVIALSMHSDKRFVTEMLRAGASGYLLKDCALDELVRAVRAVVSGHAYLSPQVADMLVKESVRKSPRTDTSVFSVLTAREREVLQLIAEGVSTKEIASRLHLSVKTVETHRRNIMEKLDVHTTADLTRYAVREGLTSL